MNTTIPNRCEELVRLHGGLRKAAESCDIDVGYFSRLRSGEKDNPTAETLRKLGLTKTVVYQYATPPASPPDGYVLMPRKMTIEMSIAFAEVWFSRTRAVDDDDMQDAYDALIESAHSADPATATPPASAPEVTPDILRIPAGDKLDAIIVYFEDEATGKGRMTVACYGDAWTAWWGSMGERTVRQFVAGTDPGYLSGALLQLRAANAMHREYTWRVAARVIAALQEGKSHG